MRSFLLLPLLLISAFAFGQVTAQAGYVTYGVPGQYAGPFIPLVVTPSVSLQQSAISPVGASNATAGNVAGATNATLSLPSPVSGATVPQAVWYGQVIPEFQAPGNQSAESESVSRRDFGAAEFQNGVGVATLISEGYGGRASIKTSKVYTNQDAEQAAQQTDQNVGTVKFNGKVQRIQ